MPKSKNTAPSQSLIGSTLNATNDMTKQLAGGPMVIKTFGIITSPSDSRVLVSTTDLRMERPGRSLRCGQGYFLPKRDRCAASVRRHLGQSEARVAGCARGDISPRNVQTLVISSAPSHGAASEKSALGGTAQLLPDTSAAAQGLISHSLNSHQNGHPSPDGRFLSSI